MLTLLSQKIETLYLSSYQKNTSLPAITAGLDPLLKVQRPPGASQTLSAKLASPLQSSIREAACRGKDKEGFQMFPVIEQRNAQGNLVRAHLPISLKLFKDLKVICAQYGTMAPFFTKTFVENMSLLALPPADWKQLDTTCLSEGD